MALPRGLARVPVGTCPVSWRGESLGLDALIDGTLPSCVEPFFVSAPAEPFFRPDPHDGAASSAAAVKDGRILRPPGGLVLDGREHDGRLAARQAWLNRAVSLPCQQLRPPGARGQIRNPRPPSSTK